MTLYVGTYQEPIASINNEVARVAAKFGADAFVNIGGHYGGRHDVETVHAHDLTSAVEALGFPALVVIETGGDLLQDYTPPASDVLYLLGPQNGTIPAFVQRWCDSVLTIETPEGLLLPTPVCAGIVLHHHYVNTDVRV